MAETLGGSVLREPGAEDGRSTSFASDWWERGDNNQLVFDPRRLTAVVI
jgi:hypothetical protein